MQRETTTLTVTVNRDMVPGTMHTEELVKETVSAILNESIGHYNPVITFAANNMDQKMWTIVYRALLHFYRETGEVSDAQMVEVIKFLGEIEKENTNAS